MPSPVSSQEVGPPAPPGETRPRRSSAHPNALITQPAEGVDTIHDILIASKRAHGDKDAVGWRDIEKVVEEEKEVTKNVAGKSVTEKKKWKYFQLSPYKFLSFNQFHDKAILAGRGLASLGVEKGSVFNIYAGTTLRWRLIGHACASVGVVIATAYETLGEEGLQHSLHEPSCVAVYTNADLLGTLARVLPKTPTVKLVIYDDIANPAVLQELGASSPDVKILSLDELFKAGEAASQLDLNDRLPKADDLACIIWRALNHALRKDDTFLAFLPLAHILEYVTELFLYYSGVTTGYGKVKTLTDTSVRNCKGDLGAFRPTLMVGVPAVWESIRKGIVGKVNQGGMIAKAVFGAAYAIKRNNIPILTSLVDAIVFSKIRQQTGGRLRIGLTGGAAMSSETQEFMNVAVLQILQGYGLTESCGMCTVLTPEQQGYGSSVKLVDVREADYLTSRTPQQGEVWIRGPSISKGYFRRDDLNNDETVFTKDGWFRTGDVGQWNADGTLRVIDRIKNLVKLQSGEYIALERLEATYKSCHLVANVCIHAVPDARQPMALVFPHEANLRFFLTSTPPPGFQLDAKQADIHALCADKSVQEVVLKECNAVGKKASFKGIEMIEAVVLTPDEWTPESGLVTAAQKIQRRALQARYREEIERAYKQD
ncbi:hypothetical protein BS47DRAFT_1376706 [Hydnum rufescens UP504]|uniref:AMP-dependent synthetase/ligase domain-containing protein n=1 Tax=Hydnum rufescens UP504 TaxID=1448309 RepID=A0A9P6AWY7_9AGAM|nr:hypothetical protein BS47DRAFT_1376706 [Hydnum rufescens UP504]